MASGGWEMASVGDGCNFVEIYVSLLLIFYGLGRPTLMGRLVLAQGLVYLELNFLIQFLPINFAVNYKFCPIILENFRI